MFNLSVMFIDLTNGHKQSVFVQGNQVLIPMTRNVADDQGIFRSSRDLRKEIEAGVWQENFDRSFIKAGECETLEEAAKVLRTAFETCFIARFIDEF